MRLRVRDAACPTRANNSMQLTALHAAADAERMLISGTPCCMLHVGIEWESVWYRNALGRKFGEEIGAACGVIARKVPPHPHLPPPGGKEYLLRTPLTRWIPARARISGFSQTPADVRAGIWLAIVICEAVLQGAGGAASERVRTHLSCPLLSESPWRR